MSNERISEPKHAPTQALVEALARDLEESRVELGSLGNDVESVEGLVVEIVDAWSDGASRDVLEELFRRVDRSPHGELAELMS